MKKIIIMGVAAGLVAFSASCNTTPKTLSSETDSLAYAIGLDVGQNLSASLKSIDSTMNKDMVIAGIKSAFSGKEGKMNFEQASAFINEYFSVRLPARQRLESETFLKNVEASNPNIRRTESGILYEIIREGAEKPSAMDQVSVVYHGTLPNGTVFDSSREQGDTVTFGLNQVIPGWTEGMQLVGKGGAIKLWIPSDLAYGEMGRQPQIAPNQALVFEVELIDVIPATPVK